MLHFSLDVLDFTGCRRRTAPGVTGVKAELRANYALALCVNLWCNHYMDSTRTPCQSYTKWCQCAFCKAERTRRAAPKYLKPQQVILNADGDTATLFVESKAYGDLRVIIDADDAYRVSQYRWTPRRDRRSWADTIYFWYADVISLHRFIMSAPVGMEVDHILGNYLDNRKSALRLATKQQNRQNRRKVRGTSRYKGVCWREGHGAPWKAAIRINHRTLNLGSFREESAAAHAYDRAAKHYFGAFACLNFPQQLDTVL